jgi:hypothetical protein
LAENDAYPGLRKLLPYTTALVIIVAIYVGYIVYTRWRERREIARQETQQVIDSARKTYEAYGSGAVTVLNFNISPAAMRRGDKGSLCYGVSNAKSVSIEPKPDDGVWPSLNRCVAVSPKKTTTYTIVAQDEQGHSATKNVTIVVQ